MSEKEKLSKSDLINMVHGVANDELEMDISKKNVRAIVDTTFNSLKACLSEGTPVTIQGFGRFETREAKPRTFKKINSDEIVEVSARNLPKVKFSKKLVESIKSN